MNKINKKYKIAIIAVVAILIVLAVNFTGVKNANGIGEGIQAIENTLKSNGYTVAVRENGYEVLTFDTLVEKSDTYFGEYSSNAQNTEYLTTYYGLFLEEEAVDTVENEYYTNGLTESSYINKTTMLGLGLLRHNGVSVPSNGEHLAALKLLGETYKPNSEEFNFVKKYEFSDDKLMLSLYYDEYMKWCYDNVEGVTRIEVAENNIGREIGIIIQFDGKYVKSIKQISGAGSAFYSEDTREWVFSNVNSVAKDLKEYVKDPIAYQMKVEEEKTLRLIAEIKEHMELGYSYSYYDDGTVRGNNIEFYSVSQYKNTYTAEEILNHLETGKDLVDKSTDWRVVYVEYIDDMSYKSETYDEFSLYDINNDGVPELIYIESWYANIYQIVDGEVRHYYGSYDVCIGEDYIYYEYGGGDECGHTIYWIDDETGNLSGKKLVNTVEYNEYTDEWEVVYYSENFKSVYDGNYYDYNGSDKKTITESEYDKAFSSMRDKSTEYLIDEGDYSLRDYTSTILNYK